MKTPLVEMSGDQHVDGIIKTDGEVTGHTQGMRCGIDQVIFKAVSLELANRHRASNKNQICSKFFQGIEDC